MNRQEREEREHRRERMAISLLSLLILFTLLGGYFYLRASQEPVGKLGQHLDVARHDQRRRGAGAASG